MNRWMSVLLLTLVCWPNFCQAKPDQSGNFMVLGSGMVSCGEWTKEPLIRRAWTNMCSSLGSKGSSRQLMFFLPGRAT
jgi:hypothetical protein